MSEISQKILVVDDEVMNLEILSEYLEDDGFEPLKAKNGKEALDILEKNSDQISAVVLDRMMPVMNGMEFLSIVKKNDQLKDIPIIMQSAAAQPEQIREGIEAGVFYYITKPFERGVFIAILKSSLEYSLKRIRVKNDFNSTKSSFKLLAKASFTVAEKKDIEHVCSFVSNAFPYPEKAFFGISELLLNAVEHGNLGITYDEKKKLLIEKKWEDEILRRYSLPENKNKKVGMEIVNKPEHFEVIITDEGKGFDYKSFLYFDENRAKDPNGRGIAMAKKYTFKEILFENNGSKVIGLIEK
jgi:CheY-like chemotaxis protein